RAGPRGRAGALRARPQTVGPGAAPAARGGFPPEGHPQPQGRGDAGGDGRRLRRAPRAPPGVRPRQAGEPRPAARLRRPSTETRMTEAEWLACTDPLPMVNLVAPKVSDRKLRLFQVACCRPVRHPLRESPFREAVEAGEGSVEGSCSAGRLDEAAPAAGEVVTPLARRVNVRLSSGDHAASGAVITACFLPGRLALPFGTFTGRYRTGA